MTYDTINILHLEAFHGKIQTLETRKENQTLIIELRTNIKQMICPSCHSDKTLFHSYQYKHIIHSVLTDGPCMIRFHHRKFKCPLCKHIFYEPNPIVDKNEMISKYTKINILNYLKGHDHTFTQAAHRYHISIQKVIDIFDVYVEAKRCSLPRVINIDEFFTSKINDYKYACVLYDFIGKKIIDVLPRRHKHYLINYFARIPNSELNRVEVVIMDMWDSYKEVVERCIPKALVAVDSFHIIRSLNEHMKRLRIDIMKKYENNKSAPEHEDIYYYMLKKFHYFFLKNYEDISDKKIYINKLHVYWHKSDILHYLLSIDDELTTAYRLKERYREFNLTAAYDTCDDELNQFIREFRNHTFEGFRIFGKTIERWRSEIKNSFLIYDHRRISNGPIESTNNKIKTILKTANGIESFKRLRNKIMYSINKDIPIRNK